jgi:hypothetical protein
LGGLFSQGLPLVAANNLAQLVEGPLLCAADFSAGIFRRLLYLNAVLTVPFFYV